MRMYTKRREFDRVDLHTGFALVSLFLLNFNSESRMVVNQICGAGLFQ
jgi:hypothetical protein